MLIWFNKQKYVHANVVCKVVSVSTPITLSQATELEQHNK